MMPTAEQEVEKILLWRLHGFEALGLATTDALELCLSGADLHEAKNMVDAGCSPELVVEILT